MQETGLDSRCGRDRTRARGDGQVVGYLLVGPVAAGQADDLDAVSVLRVGLFAEGLLEALRLPLGESDAYHFPCSLAFFPPSLYASDILIGHVYEREKDLLKVSWRKAWAWAAQRK